MLLCQTNSNLIITIITMNIFSHPIVMIIIISSVLSGCSRSNSTSEKHLHLLAVTIDSGVVFFFPSPSESF